MESKKHEITICLGSSCFSRGNGKIVDVIKDFIKKNNLDGQIFFHGELCSGTCEYGPVMKIDNQLYRKINKEKVLQILKDVFLH